MGSFLRGRPVKHSCPSCPVENFEKQSMEIKVHIDGRFCKQQTKTEFRADPFKQNLFFTLLGD
jgi:hypothetical protein